MAATAIGVDVGTNAVRAVEIELDDPPVIRRMGQVALPEGAVVDGEVADVDAVSSAMQRLWAEAGFRRRDVRIGISSARVIVRLIEMPRLSREELRSTISLQLDDYVPLAAEETVFDIRELGHPGQPGDDMQLLLAATHRDAVQPLLMAARDAKLQVSAVDVIPAALALALTGAETDEPDKVDVILSIGAGTVLVIVARAGEPVFVRTLTSASGRSTTERIAGELSISPAEAERYKRLGPTEDPISSVAVIAAQDSVRELVDEVHISLAFYSEQASALPIRRVLVTGGGSQLPGLSTTLADKLGVPVERADPFANLWVSHTGFELCDLPYLAPYMAAAVGVALGAGQPRDRRIDLTPVTKRVKHATSARRLLAGAGAVVLIGAAGMLYMRTRADVASARDQLAVAAAELADLQAQIDGRLSLVGTSQVRGASAADIAQSVAAGDVDWPAVQAAVDETRAPFGVNVVSFQGVLDEPAAGGGAGSSAPPIATLTLTATAPSIPIIADWLDAVAADPHFVGPWVSGLTTLLQPGQATVVQFTMTVGVTQEALTAPVEASEAAG
jgi:type IV pilus assembly protein PilM